MSPESYTTLVFVTGGVLGLLLVLAFASAHFTWRLPLPVSVAISLLILSLTAPAIEFHRYHRAQFFHWKWCPMMGWTEPQDFSDEWRKKLYEGKDMCETGG